jgi:hypothetical protein
VSEDPHHVDFDGRGYVRWGGDRSGQTFVAPDGYRLLSQDQALQKITEAEELLAEALTKGKP